MLTPEREKEIRYVRSQTPDSDPWEARIVDDLIGEIDALRKRNDILLEIIYDQDENERKL